VKITRAKDGRANLHIWRTGESYFRQKGPALLKEWTNLKFSLLPHPKGRPISHYDIRRPLPFPDDTFDAVYALHIIEHLTPEEASRFVAEIFRVLRPGGIVRVSTPDLESAVKAYLKRLEECSGQPTKLEIVKYEWAVLELLDQMVREQSGGLMLETARRGHFDSDYAHERYGDVFDEFHQPPASEHREPDKTLGERITSKSPLDFPRTLHRKMNSAIIGWLQRRKARQLGGDPRKMKESNLWTYDRLSLRLLLEEQGFKKFAVKNHAESDIVGWERYDLDRSNHGDHAIEPSLYVEARAQKETASHSKGAR
jgi:SAM-dependent methyltransferase